MTTSLNLSLYPKNADGHWLVPIREGGEPARIFTDKAEGSQPIVGMVKNLVRRWRADGGYYHEIGHGESSFDLLPPKWHRERAAFERGERVEFAYVSQPNKWSLVDNTTTTDYWNNPAYLFRIAEPALADWQRKLRGWVDVPQLPPIPEGFTRWNGGSKIPVADDVHVEMIFRDGERNSGPSKAWNWERAIAYRVIPPQWTLPAPPAGRSWHCDDWTQDMLPNGFRPLLKGETTTPEDEREHPAFGWQLIEANGGIRIDYADKGHWRLRTRRPLPPSFVPWNCPSDVPGPLCWFGSPSDEFQADSCGSFILNVNPDGVVAISRAKRVDIYSWNDIKVMKAVYSLDRKTWKPCTKEAK